MLSQIHDSKLVGYDVDENKHRLTLVIEPVSGDLNPFRVGFEGYIAHHFPAPMLPAILHDIVLVDAAQLIAESWKTIEAGYAECGWPGPWAHSAETASNFLAVGGYRGYRIESSYGLSGWVISKSVAKLGRREA